MKALSTLLILILCSLSISAQSDKKIKRQLVGTWNITKYEIANIDELVNKMTEEGKTRINADIEAKELAMENVDSVAQKELYIEYKEKINNLEKQKKQLIANSQNGEEAVKLANQMSKMFSLMTVKYEFTKKGDLIHNSRKTYKYKVEDKIILKTNNKGEYEPFMTIEKITKTKLIGVFRNKEGVEARMTFEKM